MAAPFYEAFSPGARGSSDGATFQAAIHTPISTLRTQTYTISVISVIEPVNLCNVLSLPAAYDAIIVLVDGNTLSGYKLML